jgi:peptide deformylase
LSMEEICSNYVRDLIESMRETMHDAPGVGLAAPQIGFPLQLVVIEDPPEAIQKLSPEQAAERERWPVPFRVLINPVLTISEGAAAEFFEGCLSLAEYTAIVPRATKVHVEGLDEHAEPLIIDATGACSVRNRLLYSFTGGADGANPEAGLIRTYKSMYKSIARVNCNP